jgi:hypothetical protein
MKEPSVGHRATSLAAVAAAGILQDEVPYPIMQANIPDACWNPANPNAERLLQAHHQQNHASQQDAHGCCKQHMR